MACEKYSGSIIDAALDTLAPAQRAEFASHVRRCAPCRESLDEARVLLEAIDGGVKALVSSEPSPHFAAKLGVRLAMEKSPRRQTQLAWIPVSALAAVLIAVAGNAIFHAKRDSIQVVGTNPSSVAPGAANKQVLFGSSNIKSAPSPGPLAVAVRPLVAKAARQPEVLVQPGQFALVRQFADSVRAGQIDGYGAVQFQQQSESGEALEIEPVDISPLQISALADPQKPDGGS